MSSPRHVTASARRRRRLAGVLAACAVVATMSLGGLAATLWSQTRPVAGDPHRSPDPQPPRASQICGNKAVLDRGPASPPPGAVVIPAGDDSGTAIAHNWTITPNTTYWFAAGIHTLGRGQFNQIIPADGDSFVGAPGAVLDGMHSNLYAFTQRASDVHISYLTIQNFGAGGENGGQGVVNHDEGSGWHIDHVTIRHNAGAGVMLGPHNVLQFSCLSGNGEYGFQGGGPLITIAHDEITGNNTDDWEMIQPGCGCSGGAKFWGVAGAIITDNYVHDNYGPGLWADTNNRSFNVSRNYIADNQGEGFIYETSYNLRLADNTFIRNALVAGPKLGGFPDAAVYISESGADDRVRGRFGSRLEIIHNTFIDNWSGVVLWENADRFCGSPANTSTGQCTLVDPAVVTTRSCNARNISAAPYYGDCRWKTQHVLVSENVFDFAPERIGDMCTKARFCGFNGVFSQWGSVPSWSPYQGPKIEKSITFGQDNHFRLNSYSGPWHFMVQAQGNVVSWNTWRTGPYEQDAGSIMLRSRDGVARQ